MHETILCDGPLSKKLFGCKCKMCYPRRSRSTLRFILCESDVNDSHGFYCWAWVWGWSLDTGDGFQRLSLSCPFCRCKDVKLLVFLMIVDVRHMQCTVLLFTWQCENEELFQDELCTLRVPRLDKAKRFQFDGGREGRVEKPHKYRDQLENICVKEYNHARTNDSHTHAHVRAMYVSGFRKRSQSYPRISFSALNHGPSLTSLSHKKNRVTS